MSSDWDETDLSEDEVLAMWDEGEPVEVVIGAKPRAVVNPSAWHVGETTSAPRGRVHESPLHLSFAAARRLSASRSAGLAADAS
ncbi:MAG: hypothetical protein ACRD0K_07385 [Egibacteraceae bacterium]